MCLPLTVALTCDILVHIDMEGLSRNVSLHAWRSWGAVLVRRVHFVQGPAAAAAAAAPGPPAMPLVVQIAPAHLPAAGAGAGAAVPIVPAPPPVVLAVPGQPPAAAAAAGVPGPLASPGALSVSLISSAQTFVWHSLSSSCSMQHALQLPQ